MSLEYAWSINNERYQGELPTREAALADAVQDGIPEGVTHIYTGTIQRFSVTDFSPHAEDIIEKMQDHAYDQVGEAGEDWLSDLSRDQIQDLDERIQAAVVAWAAQYDIAPYFWGIDCTLKHSLPLEGSE